MITFFGEKKMAKTRKENSIKSALSAVTAALRLESIPNPTDAQKKEIHDAKVAAADVIDSSSLTTLGEFADEDVEARIAAEEAAEQVEADALAEQEAEARAEQEAEAEAEAEETELEPEQD